MGQAAPELIDKLIEIDRKNPTTILVVGDPMTDIYVYGNVAECQDHCKKISEQTCVVVPGGAANAARTLEHWKARIEFPFKDCHGSVKTRFMDGNQCLFRHDDDNTYCEEYTTPRAAAFTILNQYNVGAVLISDYDKGAMSEDFIRTIILKCKKKNIPCIADAKREPRLYKGAIVKCNEPYANKHLWNGAMDAGVVTRGELPPIITGKYGKSGLPPVPCINHVGAGDCFAAHLTLAMAYGFSLKDASAIAYSAGRVYVQRPHNNPPRPNEIRADTAIAMVGCEASS